MLSQIWIPGWMVISMLSFCTTVRGSNCRHILDEQGGFINSENYPELYPDDHTCEWTITVKAGSTVSLRFFSFNTEGGYDSVKVYDGTNKNARQIANYNGTTVPDVLFSTGRSMYIFFHTDRSKRRAGFTGVLTPSVDESCQGLGSLLCAQVCTDKTGTFECSCNEGFRVAENVYKCRECDDWTYGMECSRSCPCNVKTTDYCDKTNGRCVCKDGWTGIDCSTVLECDEWTYGALCSSTCPCNVKTTNYCDKTNGRCVCKDGWTGIDCSTVLECDEWTYGVLCSSTCSCNVNTTNYCNKTNGWCVCKDGWTGIDCSTVLECDKWTYGVLCAIIGVLGFLLLTAVIVIAVLVYKWRRKEKETMGIAPPPPDETMPLDEVIRICSSDAQTQRETPGTINRDSHVYEEMTAREYGEMTDISDYEVPVVPATVKKPTNRKTTVPNKYGKFPKHSSKGSHDPTDREVEIYENVPAKKEDTRH